MSVNGSNNFLNIEDANLRVRNGSVHAQGMTIGGAIVSASHGLQSVSDTGNTTSNTLQFTNATTAFKATSNIELTSASKIIVDSNVVTEYTGPHDRPLREYPEVKFPLSTSSESPANGATTFTYKSYTVTGNSVYNDATSKISNAFDGEEHVTSWTGLLGDYDSNGDVASGKTANYLQIQLPNAIKLEKMKIISDGNYQYANAPRNITLYGSNNGSNWVTLKTETDLQLDGGTTNPDPQTVFVHVNATTKYMYYKLEISKIWISSGGATYARIGEWDLYGHEEGSASLDTTLKSVYNVPATTGTQLEVYYDAKDFSSGSIITDKVGNANATISSGSDITFDSTYKAWVFGGDTNRTQTIKTGTLPTSLTGGANAKPEISAALWFNPTVWGDDVLFMIANPAFDQTDNQFLEVRINGNQDWRIQVWDGQHAGHYSVPGFADSAYDMPVNNWYHLAVSISGKTSPSTERKVYVNGIECTFKSQDATPSGVLNLPTDSQLQLGKRPTNGSGADPTDVGGKHFFGSIANFRLYSKALNAGQVQELYDYQKDYFLGSKSQVTLYKGHLGVGVTEPSGQLELAGDERIQEYPPRGLTGYETYIEGHGVFCATTNSFYTPGNYLPYYAFDKQHGPDFATTSWNTNSPTYSSSTGLPTSGASLGGYSGESLKLKLPYSVKVSQYQLSVRGAWYTYGPDDWVILGSNDDNNWEVLDSVSSANWPASSGDTELIKKYTVNNTKYYKYLALVVTKAANSRTEINFSELRYFGTPGPTTIDKGSLTLGRSLDVPRVSRYDVDTETPRPEKLVVDFDTTVNESPTDISGKGNHGTLVGATHSPADKAFDFSGSNNVIYVPSLNPTMTGDVIFSMSCWFKVDNSTTRQTVMWIGSNAAAADFIDIRIKGGYIGLSMGWDPDTNMLGIKYTDQVLENNRWYHVVGVKSGTGAINSSTTAGMLQLYLDGVKLNTVDGGLTDSSGLNIPTDHNQLTIGAGNENGTSVAFAGQISNPKLYSVALEASEVQKLYRLGRTGRSMVISDTAVGIGKVPEAQLDVRGNINCDGVFRSKNPIAFEAYYTDGTLSTTGTYLPNYVRYNYGGCYEQSTGRFYAPINGIYAFHWHAYTNQGDSTSRIFIDVNGADRGQKGNSLQDMGQQLSFSIYLNAGDYLRLKGKSSYTLYFHGHTNHNMYSGHLVIAM